MLAKTPRWKTAAVRILKHFLGLHRQIESLASLLPTRLQKPLRPVMLGNKDNKTALGLHLFGLTGRSANPLGY